MKGVEAFPIVACRDLARTRHFYRSAFGAAQRYAYPAAGDPEFVTLRIGATTIGLADGTAPPVAGPAPFPATGRPVDLCIYVTDLDAVLAAAASHGGELVAPAADMPWGERVGWVRDPEGVHVLVIQSP